MRDESGATIDGRYRYNLWRGSVGRNCLFIMLNPSTADGMEDDPTIRRCRSFAEREGCGRLTVVNLFALRSTDPKALRRDPDPVGPENDQHIMEAVRRAHVVVAAWGTHGTLMRRGAEVTHMIQRSGVALRSLGTTKDGHPRHPLYLRRDAPLIPFVFSPLG